MSASVSNPASKIIVALDTPSLDVVKQLLRELDEVISFYKIGSELFTAHGWAAVELVRKYQGKVFLDLKFHDIPNTVSKAAAVACEHEVEMFNVHVSGGAAMMKEVRKIVDERCQKDLPKPIVLGVTVLTSLTEQDLNKDLNVSKKMEDQVMDLARLAKKSGLDGIVCSPHEIARIRKELGKDFVIVTPGIRPAKAAKGDQKRIMTPKEAVELGADYLVIGRPIVAAENPLKEAISIVKSLS